MATAQAQATAAPTRQHMTLAGSVGMVHEFFSYALQSILYQRELYPPEDFRTVKKYGLQILVAADEELATYVSASMEQIHAWLLAGQIDRLVIAIVDVDSGDVRERWQFSVQVTAADAQEQERAKEGQKPPPTNSKKTDADVRAEIAAIIKQITASCTFLPLLDGECSFQIQAYTNADAPVPEEWVISAPQLIDANRAEQVRLRSFSTAVHKVDAMVAYRRDEGEADD